MILFKMAWRNNWRHKWRSALTIAAIVFGLSLTVWGFCLTEGSHEQMIRNSVESFSGHIQINRKGYQDDPSLRKSFKPDSALYRILENHRPDLADWGARITTFALASVGETSFAAMVVGIEPEREARFIHWDRKIAKGEYLRPQDMNGVLVGEDLADNLGVGLGDTVIVVTQNFYGSLAGALRVVRGIFRSHSPELDRGGMLMNLFSAQDMLSMDGRVNTIVVMTSSGEQVDPVSRSLAAALQGQDMEIIPWYEILPDLVQAVELDNIFGLLTNAILILVIGFMVLNTFLMGVLERIREFGIMRSLGASPGKVVGLIALEAVLLNGLGFLLGNVIGLAVSWYNSIHPLDLSSLGEDVYKMYGVDPRIYTHLTWGTVFYPNLFVMVIIMLALIYPAWRASRIKPAEAVARIR
ncbi:MAG TPA: FtsX-like permease family protein [archaeon]|nr:FtsX-like permease family protein [archaeon]